MPTRKVSEREKLTIFARTATDEELDQAFEILSIERRIRTGAKAKVGQKPARTRNRQPAPGPDAKPDDGNPQG